MKVLKVTIPMVTMVILLTFILNPVEGAAAGTGEAIFKDYQVVEVREFEVPPNVPAPDSAGRRIADEIVYQIRRYSYKFHLFDMVIIEGKREIPPDKKVLLVKGTVDAFYVRGTCAIHCQFVDKKSGHILYKTRAKGLIFRVGEYIAKVIYLHKRGKR
ncbi:MAG: hypothetical protein DRG50_09030 [Deltaproteobacteria bacterium]|nr:MAG: hypothetical protein DRG50_09030 [Deltaproteobacteria bacterium]